MRRICPWRNERAIRQKWRKNAAGREHRWRGVQPASKLQCFGVSLSTGSPGRRIYNITYAHPPQTYAAVCVPECPGPVVTEYKHCQQYMSYTRQSSWKQTPGCRNLFNHLKPTGYVMHQQFNIQQLYGLPTPYLCVLYLSENRQRLVPLTA